MNTTQLIGRLTKDPETKYTGETQMAITNFTLAIDRQYTKGKEKETDFIRCKAFGKTAELIDKYAGKGGRLGVTGRIQTGSYKDKEGRTVYTTEVIVDRPDFIDWRDESEERIQEEDPGDSFAALDVDVPF